MNIDHLIESIHEENALRRRAESGETPQSFGQLPLERGAAGERRAESWETPQSFGQLPLERGAARERRAESGETPQSFGQLPLKRGAAWATSLRKVGRFALPAAAVAAVLLIVLLPRGNEAQASTPAPGIYCNSRCSPDDVIVLIDNNINHIKEIQIS